MSTKTHKMSTQRHKTTRQNNHKKTKNNHKETLNVHNDTKQRQRDIKQPQTDKTTTNRHTSVCVLCERGSSVFIKSRWMTWRVKYLTLLLLHYHKDVIRQTIRASRSIWSVECLTESASSFKASEETLTISAAASTSAGITLHFHCWVKHPGDYTPSRPCMFDLFIVLDKGFTWWLCSAGKWQEEQLQLLREYWWEFMKSPGGQTRPDMFISRQAGSFY